MYTPPEQVRDEVRFWLAKMHEAAGEHATTSDIERETTEIEACLIELEPSMTQIVEVCSLKQSPDGIACEYRKRTQVESKVERAGFFITERTAIILNALKTQKAA